MFKTYSSSSSLVITSRWFATSRLVAPVSVRLVYCMTLPFDHAHYLDLGVEISRSEPEIALSQEWDGRLTWNEKDVSHPFMTMILPVTSVTMVGWADVPDSDWGDFRRQRAVDISSFSRIIFKLGKDIYYPKISNEFDHGDSALLNMRIIDHFMSQHFWHSWTHFSN